MVMAWPSLAGATGGADAGLVAAFLGCDCFFFSRATLECVKFGETPHLRPVFFSAFSG